MHLRYKVESVLASNIDFSMQHLLHAASVSGKKAKENDLVNSLKVVREEQSGDPLARREALAFFLKDGLTKQQCIIYIIFLI